MEIFLQDIMCKKLQRSVQAALSYRKKNLAHIIFDARGINMFKRSIHKPSHMSLINCCLLLSTVH